MKRTRDSNWWGDNSANQRLTMPVTRWSGICSSTCSVPKPLLLVDRRWFPLAVEFGGSGGTVALSTYPSWDLGGCVVQAWSIHVLYSTVHSDCLGDGHIHLVGPKSMNTWIFAGNIERRGLLPPGVSKVSSCFMRGELPVNEVNVEERRAKR